MIFIDTGAWIALSDRKDKYHGASVKIYQRLKSERQRLLTTDYIIDESVTRFRYDLNHTVAINFLKFIESIEKTGLLNIVNIDDKLFQNAKALFRKYDSVILSFTDATSFVVCQNYNISEAFAFDQHFTMMGVILLVA